MSKLNEINATLKTRSLESEKKFENLKEEFDKLTESHKILSEYSQDMKERVRKMELRETQNRGGNNFSSRSSGVNLDGILITDSNLNEEVGSVAEVVDCTLNIQAKNYKNSTIPRMAIHPMGDLLKKKDMVIVSEEIVQKNQKMSKV